MSDLLKNSSAKPNSIGKLYLPVVKFFHNKIGETASSPETFNKIGSFLEEGNFWNQEATDANINKLAENETKAFLSSNNQCEKTIGGFLSTESRYQMLKNLEAKKDFSDLSIVTSGLNVLGDSFNVRYKKVCDFFRL